MAHGQRIRLVVVDDHPLIRDGIAELLQPCDDIQIVAEASDGRQGVDLTLQLRPNVVLMDIHMPVMSGIQATEEIRRLWPAARVIILTSHRGDFYARKAIKVGAFGYLNKAAAPQDLVATIRNVAMGIRTLPQEIAQRLVTAVAEGELTPREIEVLRLVAKEGTNRRIALSLGVTEDTVKVHVRSILAKLKVRDRTNAVIVGIQRGFIDLYD